MEETKMDDQAPSMASGTTDTDIDWEMLVKGEHVWISWPGQNDSKNLGPVDDVCEAFSTFLADVQFARGRKPGQ
jgi:hypothetical protein